MPAPPRFLLGFALLFSGIVSRIMLLSPKKYLTLAKKCHAQAVGLH
jgi:hypothetical protein